LANQLQIEDVHSPELTSPSGREAHSAALLQLSGVGIGLEADAPGQDESLLMEVTARLTEQDAG
jgi:hypothetical protein